MYFITNIFYIMVEKEKNIEKIENKTNNKKVKKNRGIFWYLIFLILIALTVIIALGNNNTSKLFKDFIFKKETVIDDDKKEIQDYSIQKLNQEISVIQKELKYNSENLNYLQSKIDELETNLGKVNINPQRIELLKIAMRVENDIDSNLDYSHDLTILKTLSKKDTFLIEKITILEQYKDFKIDNELIEKTFDEELKKSLKENNSLGKKDSKFLKFLSNFITIRKTKNVENDSYEFFLFDLEKAMRTHNYSMANMFLENSIYSKEFPLTLKNVKTISLLNNTIEEIINYLVNNE